LTHKLLYDLPTRQMDTSNHSMSRARAAGNTQTPGTKSKVSGLQYD